MNLTVTGAACPRAPKLTPCTHTEPPHGDTDATEQGWRHKVDRKALLLGHLSPRCLCIQVCVQTRGRRACGLLLVLDSVSHFLTAGRGRAGGGVGA